MNKEDLELTKRFEKIVKKLVLELKEINKDDWYRPQASGKTKDGGEVYLTQQWNKPTHVHVSGHYPKDKLGELHTYGVSDVSINISLSKSDEQIVKDIQRRFFPQFEENLKQVIGKVERSNLANNNRKNNMELLAKELGVTTYNGMSRSSYPEISKYYGDGSVNSLDVKTDYNSEQFTFELRVDFETAKKLVRFINEVKQ